MKISLTYVLELNDELGTFGKRLAEAAAVCGAYFNISAPGREKGCCEPPEWDLACKAYHRIFTNGQFTPEDVQQLSVKLYRVSERCVILAQTEYWPVEVRESKRMAVDRLREEIDHFDQTFVEESGDL